MESTTIAYIALIVAIITGLFGIFGGVPGIKALFFNKPSIKIVGFLPVVVFDEGSNVDSNFPKFSLKGLLKVSNPNNFDISINELRVYGTTQDSSGKYKFPGNKPIIYEMNLTAILDDSADIVKAHASSFIKFKISHFDNTEEPGVMRAPMKAVGNPELGHPIFHIFIPSFNQLFKWNDRRSPYELVDHVKRGELNFAVVFNNEFIKIPPNMIFSLHKCDKNEWENTDELLKAFNIKANI